MQIYHHHKFNEWILHLEIAFAGINIPADLTFAVMADEAAFEMVWITHTGWASDTMKRFSEQMCSSPLFLVSSLYVHQSTCLE